jgi:cytidylate kinase
MSRQITEKLIQRHINQWNRFREFLHDSPPEEHPLPGPVITVSRQAGAGGRSLATALAERWELELQDQSLVDRIARDANLEKAVVAQLDERTVSQTQLWIQGVLHNRLFLRDDYHTALVKTISNLAARGSVVFLGRGANLILGQHATLRIRVVASHSSRMANLTDRTGLSRPEVRALLDETDRKREKFIREVFGEEPGGVHNFDVTFNSDRLDLAQMAEAATLLLLGRKASGNRTIPAQV